MDGVATHDQTTTIHIVEHVPYHPTREDDPYYHLFNEARNRMKKLGLLKCWVCGCESNIEVPVPEFSKPNPRDQPSGGGS